MTKDEQSKKIQDHRRKRLQLWIDQNYNGSQADYIVDTPGVDEETGEPKFINQGELSGLLKKKSFGEKKARALEVQSRMPPMWLDRGFNEEEQIKKPAAPQASFASTIEEWDEETPLREDETEMSFFKEVQLAAGSGRSHVQENHGRKLRFSKRTLSRYGVQASAAYCVTSSGNSMEPVIPDGATVGIDTNKTHIKDGDIYAIDHNGHLRIKILYKTPYGKLRLRSFNEEEWPEENVNEMDVKVLGRVFWYSVLR
jgi:phage repressor protein C with HTH and peptisase S24 domain